MTGASNEVTDSIPLSGLRLLSLLTTTGELELSLEARTIDALAPNEVVVRVEASPVNPSDLELLLGAADVSTAKAVGEETSRRMTMSVPDAGRRAMAGRLGQALTIGDEGAGVVIAEGQARRP